MKVLFLDDSYVSATGYLGYGGFVLDSDAIRPFADAVNAVKRKHGISRSVEIKWSPPRDHFLRTNFAGSRADLYGDLLGIVPAYGGRNICALHAINELYGVRLHGWDRGRAALFAAKQQLKFLAERFEANVLQPADDHGLIISDRYGSRDGERDLIRDFEFEMIFGTDYQDLTRLAMPPLMVDSRHSEHTQVADVVVGVVVGALGGSEHAEEQFERVARALVCRPGAAGSTFVSQFSTGVLGYGVKLFPTDHHPEGMRCVRELNDRYLVTENGVVERR